MWETAGFASSKAPAVCPGLPRTTWKSLMAPRNPGVSLPGFLGAGSAAPGAPSVRLRPGWVQAHARSLQAAVGPGWGLKGDRGLPISLLSAAVPLPAPALRVSGCARLPSVWHIPSRLFCVKHGAGVGGGPSRGRTCAGPALAALSCREIGRKFWGWGQTVCQLSCHPWPQGSSCLWVCVAQCLGAPGEVEGGRGWSSQNQNQ